MKACPDKTMVVARDIKPQTLAIDLRKTIKIHTFFHPSTYSFALLVINFVMKSLCNRLLHNVCLC